MEYFKVVDLKQESKETQQVPIPIIDQLLGFVDGIVNIAKGTETTAQDAIKETLLLGLAKIKVVNSNETANSELKILISIAEFKVLSLIKKFRVQ